MYCIVCVCFFTPRFDQHCAILLGQVNRGARNGVEISYTFVRNLSEIWKSLEI